MQLDSPEFDGDKSIEPGQLDVECVKQAETFFKWAERYSAAKAEADRQEFDLKVLESKLQLKCREDPETYGLKNPTEAAVKAAVQCHPKYTEAMDTLFRARERATLLQYAVAAMEQKKRMLEVLITLHGQEYFAGPSVPHNLVEVWESHRKRGGEVVDDRQRGVARRRVRKED